MKNLKFKYLLCITFLFIFSCDDGGVTPILGCADEVDENGNPNCNYDEGANTDDGTCVGNPSTCGPGGTETCCDCDGNELDDCEVCGGGNADQDCAGVCDGDSALDDCGVCDGSGIPDGECDCSGNVLDECGICGGSGPSGECGCSDIADGACDCDGNVLDECGECGGSGIPEGECDCNGNVLDECDVCDGSGISDGECDCDGNVLGCDDVCGSELVDDECDECGGNGPADGFDCDGTVLYSAIQDIFDNNCGSCHLSGSSGGLNLSNYDNLMSNNVIVPNDHLSSYLWERVDNGEMPPGSNPDLTQTEVDLIATWIDQGANSIGLFSQWIID